jgi:hypothetical protein
MPELRSVIDGLDKHNFSQCPIPVPMDTPVGASFPSWEGIKDFHRYIVGCSEAGDTFELYWIARISRDRAVFYRSVYSRPRLSLGDNEVLDAWVRIAKKPPATDRPPAYVEPVPVTIAVPEEKPKAETKKRKPKTEPIAVEAIEETYEFTYEEETPLPLLNGAVCKRYKRYPFAVPESLKIGSTIPDSQPLNVVWITRMTFDNGEISVWYFYSIDGGLMEYRKAVYSSASLSPEDTQTLRDMWVCSRTPIVTVEDPNAF